MENEDTICYKITESLEDLKELIHNGHINITEYSDRLHQIRKDAERMENALKLRKKIMTDAGLEEKYKKEKGEFYADKGVNKLRDTKREGIKEPTPFEIIIKQNNEVVYQRIAYGGAFSIVEEISDIDAYGSMDGRSQQLFFGHPLVIYYGFDQLRQAMEAKNIDILAALKKIMADGGLSKLDIKRKLLLAANRNLK